MNYKLIERDLNDTELREILNSALFISIDTETTGLNPYQDKLKLIQISVSDEYFFLIRVSNSSDYLNLKKVLSDSSLTKYFHNAIFDIRFIYEFYNNDIVISNVKCTKISEKLINESSNFSSLKNLTKKYLDVSLSKEERLSDWSASKLSDKQIQYALRDVIYLSRIWSFQKKELSDLNKLDIAVDSFDYINTQTKIERMGIDNIFSY